MINQSFNQKNYGAGRYQPDFYAFFPKLSRGHSQMRSGCVAENCGKANPHTGSNFTAWREERGIKKPEGT